MQERGRKENDSLITKEQAAKEAAYGSLHAGSKKNIHKVAGGNLMAGPEQNIHEAGGGIQKVRPEQNIWETTGRSPMASSWQSTRGNLRSRHEQNIRDSSYEGVGSKHNTKVDTY